MEEKRAFTPTRTRDHTSRRTWRPHRLSADYTILADIMPSKPFADVLAATRTAVRLWDGLKGAVDAAIDGDELAVHDRNNHEEEWRRVRLSYRAAEPEQQRWRLLSEDGAALDEPGSGCPATG